MKTISKLVAAIAVTTASTIVVAEEVRTAPVFMPYAPVTMTVADQEAMAKQHNAFIEQQTAALKEAMEVQRQFAVEQARMMEQQRKAHESFVTNMPAPFTAPEMPAHYGMPHMPEMPKFAMPEMPGFEMREMPAPMAMNDLPRAPVFGEYPAMHPQVRRDAMMKYYEEMRQAMQKRREDMHKHYSERRDEMKKQIEERRASIAKDRAKLPGFDA